MSCLTKARLCASVNSFSATLTSSIHSSQTPSLSRWCHLAEQARHQSQRVSLPSAPFVWSVRSLERRHWGERVWRGSGPRPKNESQVYSDKVQSKSAVFWLQVEDCKGNCLSYRANRMHIMYRALCILWLFNSEPAAQTLHIIRARDQCS